ncbi:hypothetical protein VIGAN_08367700 [Vigna angularis var. angularis]|uniref:Auxin-induced protein n=1 Tax=Vigna angularis var. angularis TaxID=157739 RepID=A0A0S3SV13_PHAAN|nr:hypothetical protein VIGAN_08367700 [Vigna angularis var. angularis]
MESRVVFESDLNLKATELRLGLPGTEEKEDKNLRTHAVLRNNKRQVRETSQDSISISNASHHQQHVETVSAPPLKAKIVGWPPIRSYRKNSVQEGEGDGIFVKVSLDGAPYLRKIDLKVYRGYPELLKALETMFKLAIGEIPIFIAVFFCCGVLNETSLNENNLNWVLLDQVSTLKERVIRGLNMLLHMKTRMVTGC